MIAVNDIVHVTEIDGAEWIVREVSPTKVQLKRRLQTDEVPPVLSMLVTARVHITELPDFTFQPTSITRYDLRLQPVLPV